MKKKTKNKVKMIMPIAAVITLTATFLVGLGVVLLNYGLHTGNEFWVALSPDIVGAGTLIFTLMIVSIILGFFGLKIKMKYM